MIFLDGLGVGEDNPERNPLANYSDIWPVEGQPPSRTGLRCASIDACLGVNGLPQSASGQTALLTGVNAPRLFGRHLQGFPSRRLVEILKRKSIFLRLKNCGLQVTFANAYRHPEDIEPSSRLSVTSHALKVCGEPFRSVKQIPLGEALYHDFTNQSLREKGYDLPLLTPQQAGKLLVKIALDYDFTLYEHFLTDVLAHRGDINAATRHIGQLSVFIRTVLDEIDPVIMTVIITSDHGNCEDMGVKTHTRNRVPLLWTGSCDVAAGTVPKDIAGITPWVMRLLNCDK